MVLSKTRLRNLAQILLSAALLTIGLGSVPLRAADAHVKIGRTMVTGLSSGGIARFLGLRYGQAPVGDLRWKPTVPAAVEGLAIDATRAGAACPQGKSPWGFPSSNEDCLFLNVTVRDDGAPTTFWQGKPVMVFFHGGGFTGGAGDLYDAGDLVRENDVVVVTVNYRLGALGFLAHPALDAEDHPAANYGLMDQQQSLRWVRDNIAAFGGDPNNVTVFGESAGAIAIYTHIVSPMAAGLFQKAIIESGAPADETLETAEKQGQALAQKLNCPTDASAVAAECLRKVPADALVAAQATPIATIIDGSLLQKSIGDALKAGEYNRVPVINGTNHDEGNLIAAFMFDLSGAPLTAGDYEKALEGIGGFIPRVGFSDAAIPAIAKAYALSGYNSPGLAAAQVITDGVIACPAYETNKDMAKYSKTFEYEMADTDARSIVAPPISFPYRAGHFSELQYLFDLSSITLKGTPEMTDAQKALGKEMRAYWTNFARTGDPSGNGVPQWVDFTEAKAGPVQSLDKPQSTSVEDFAARHQCDFWRSVERK